MACNGDGGTPPKPPPSSRPTRITIAPSDTTILVGADAQLRVTAYNSAGKPVTTPSLTFTSSNVDIASLSTSGIVGANSIGLATVSATVTGDTVKATATIRVNPVVVELPFPPGAGHVEVYGVNDARTVVGAGYQWNGDGAPRAFAYTPAGGARVLPVLDPNAPIPSQARGVNASGTITGYATRPVTFKRLVTWTPAGAITDLGAPVTTGNAQAWGKAINASGQIAAYGDALAQLGYKQRAYLYDPATRAFTDLGGLTGKDGESEPLAINDAGAIVGTSRRADGRLSGFIWTRSAGMRELAPPSGTGGAVGLTSDGRIGGWYYAVATVPSPRGYAAAPNAAASDIGTLGGAQTSPLAMNERGEIVGWSLTAAGVRHAFFWRVDGGMIDLGASFELPTRASAVAGSVVAGTVDVSAGPPPFNQRGVNERPVLWIVRRGP
jgi:probable HAF family extracellular repeat protein